VRQVFESLFEPEPSAWLVRRLAGMIDGLTQGDVKAALSRARITLDIPAADSGVAALPHSPAGDSQRKTPRSRRGHGVKYDVSVKQLIDVGLIRPGAELRQRYLGQDVTATVERDGRIRVGGEIHNSLSIAAGAARVAVKGPPDDGRRYYQTNGWSFWHCVDANGRQVAMGALRDRYIQDRSRAAS
jgi:Restriction Enzyme Adenine Methylase Associated